MRPVMPNTIMAGLMTCRSSPAPLPPDLATFVEEVEHGVVLVSFGSVIKASKMPEEKRKLMLKVFSKLKNYLLVSICDAEICADSLAILHNFLTADSLKYHIYVTTLSCSLA